MLFAWLKPKQPQNGEALGFIQALALEAALPFTVLAAPGRNGLEVATFGPRSSDLRPWLAKRADKRLFMLTAQALGPLAGRAILEADLVQTRIVTVAVPAAKRRALDAFRPAPSIIAETPKGLVAAWRLRNPTPPAKALTIAAHIAERIGGVPLGHLFPLPGCGGVRLVQHLKGPGSWALVSDLVVPGACAAARAFARDASAASGGLRKATIRSARGLAFFRKTQMGLSRRPQLSAAAREARRSKGLPFLPYQRAPLQGVRTMKSAPCSKTCARASGCIYPRSAMAISPSARACDRGVLRPFHRSAR